MKTQLYKLTGMFVVWVNGFTMKAQVYKALSFNNSLIKG